MPANAKLTVGALEKLPAKVKIVALGQSVSVISVASNKSANGMIKRHCVPCGFKLSGNMSNHKKDVHGGLEVESVKCTGD